MYHIIAKLDYYKNKLLRKKKSDLISLFYYSLIQNNGYIFAIVYSNKCVSIFFASDIECYFNVFFMLIFVELCYRTIVSFSYPEVSILISFFLTFFMNVSIPGCSSTLSPHLSTVLYVKVSKFQKQIFFFSVEPKTGCNYFLISALNLI